MDTHGALTKQFQRFPLSAYIRAPRTRSLSVILYYCKFNVGRAYRVLSFLYIPRDKCRATDRCVNYCSVHTARRARARIYTYLAGRSHFFFFLHYVDRNETVGQTRNGLLANTRTSPAVCQLVLLLLLLLCRRIYNIYIYKYEFVRACARVQCVNACARIRGVYYNPLCERIFCRS